MGSKFLKICKTKKYIIPLISLFMKEVYCHGELIS